MKIILSCILVFCVASCDLDNNNHGYGYEYDVISRDGIALIFEAEQFPVDLDFIDSVYYEAKQCTGLTAPPPPYIVVKKEQYRFLINGDEYLAVVKFNPPLILTANNHVDRYDILMHEFLHYILHINGLNQSNITHNRDADIFYNCGAYIV